MFSAMQTYPTLPTTIVSASTVGLPGVQAAGSDAALRTLVVLPCPYEVETNDSKKKSAMSPFMNICFGP